MRQTLHWKHHAIAVAVVSAWCLVMALSYTLSTYESVSGRGGRMDWMGEFLVYAVCCGSWILLAPIMLQLFHAWPFSRGRWSLAALVHLGAGLVLSQLRFFLVYLLFGWILGIKAPVFSLSGLFTGFLNYLTFLAIYSVIDFYVEYRRRELDASRLESQLARAELDVLKMQIQPHFLFNTLNTIASLNHRDVRSANRVISRLSELLRISLDQIGLHEIPLRQEVDFLEVYLDIERVRFEDRLEVAMEIEAETLGALVPNLILQPLVENAVRHGIGRITGMGKIILRARRLGSALALDVEDNGPGPDGHGQAGRPRMGLSNTKARLAQMYGAAGSVEIERASGGGCLARVSLPFQIEGDARL